jgi:hypothetical protein
MSGKPVDLTGTFESPRPVTEHRIGGSLSKSRRLGQSVAGRRLCPWVPRNPNRVRNRLSGASCGSGTRAKTGRQVFFSEHLREVSSRGRNLTNDLPWSLPLGSETTCDRLSKIWRSTSWFARTGGIGATGWTDSVCSCGSTLLKTPRTPCSRHWHPRRAGEKAPGDGSPSSHRIWDFAPSPSGGGPTVGDRLD